MKIFFFLNSPLLPFGKLPFLDLRLSWMLGLLVVSCSPPEAQSFQSKVPETVLTSKLNWNSVNWKVPQSLRECLLKSVSTPFILSLLSNPWLDPKRLSWHNALVLRLRKLYSFSIEKTLSCSSGNGSSSNLFIQVIVIISLG